MSWPPLILSQRTKPLMPGRMRESSPIGSRLGRRCRFRRWTPRPRSRRRRGPYRHIKASCLFISTLAKPFKGNKASKSNHITIKRKLVRDFRMSAAASTCQITEARAIRIRLPSLTTRSMGPCLIMTQI